MPDKAAVIFEGAQISWAELWEQVGAAAPLIAEMLDSDRQQVVAVLLPNSIDFIITYLAIVHSGHMALLLDPAYKHLEHQAVISQMRPKLLIADKADAEGYELAGTRFLAVSDLLSRDSREQVDFLRLPADEQVACLMFTSGTTGKPKAVPNTHSNILWNIRVCSQVWNWTGDDSLLINSPLSHMIGIVMGIPGSLYHGNTIYLQKWFDADETLKILASGKVSFYSQSASAYVKLVQTEGDYDLSKVRLCVSGAAPLPPAVWQEFQDRFGLQIRETYGSSETGRIAANRIDQPIVHGSPGQPLPEVDLKLSESGEVLVKSPGVFPGYFQNPEATAESTTEDGFWRTGDIAEIKNGYIYLKGRRQERIRRFGYTISPRDVEWALHQHPAVKDIYVMGRQRPAEPNDELVYFVVSEADEDSIRRFTKKNLLFAWRPDKIIYVDALPRTRSGKTKIGELKKMLEDAS